MWSKAASSRLASRRLARRNRPERDRTEEDTVDTADPVIIQIAQRLNIHPAIVCMKWAIQRGEVVIPFSTTHSHYLANLRSAVTEPLTDEEMAAIAGIDKNCRLIKGQVFLWKDEQSWEDLWDIHGEITQHNLMTHRYILTLDMAHPALKLSCGMMEDGSSRRRHTPIPLTVPSLTGYDLARHSDVGMVIATGET